MRKTSLLILPAMLFLLLAGAGFGADAKLDAAPAGIAPTTMTLAQLLDAHQKAVGKYPPTELKTAREKWTFTDAGTSGSETLVRSGTDYHSIISDGPFTDEYGQHNHKRWHLNTNGLSTAAEGSEERSFYTARVLEDAADPKNDARVLGEVPSPVRAYVVEVKTPGSKHPEWIFYDKATFLIVRVEGAVGGQRLVSTYDDFRRTSGVMQAWHIHDSDGRAYLDDDWKRGSLSVGEYVDYKEFLRPPDRRILASYSGPATLPGRFKYGSVVVRVEVNGRGLDFELSSGSNGIFIDRQVARELNLPTFGKLVETPEGKPLDFITKASDLSVGSVHFGDIALHTTAIHYHVGEETKIVGLLGYDFLKNQVLQVNYVDNNVTVLDPKTIDAKAAEPGVITVPVALDDGLPFVDAKVGETIGHRFIFDISELRTILFGGFTVPHSDDVKDLGRGEKVMVPYVRHDQAGDTVDFRLAEIAHFVFGNADHQRFLVYSTNIPQEFDGEQIDGYIGLDFAIYYDVIFDYSHDRVLLKPNKWFFDRFKLNKT